MIALLTVLCRHLVEKFEKTFKKEPLIRLTSADVYGNGTLIFDV